MCRASPCPILGASKQASNSLLLAFASMVILGVGAPLFCLNEERAMYMSYLDGGPFPKNALP
jgi:hypothetical protein